MGPSDEECSVNSRGGTKGLTGKETLLCGLLEGNPVLEMAKPLWREDGWLYADIIYYKPPDN